ncbi:hypothetical protein AAE478_001056 [Parahypoxylon ruwenzoriense]
MVWPRVSFAIASLVWEASLVYSAINLDGTQAVEPLNEDDPSPVGDPATYYPDQHDCPLSCVDYSNTHSWIPYFSVDRLHRCQEPMLLQLSVTQPLDDPASNILIRSCTLGSRSDAVSVAATPVENPKKASALFEASLGFAPACAVTGAEIQENLEMTATSGRTEGEGTAFSDLLDGMQKFFDAQDNCDESFLFAYHKQTVASVYIGSGLGKLTVESALKALAGRLPADSSVPNRVVVQLCGKGRQPERVFGVSIDTAGDLAAVQKTALEWSKGNCAINEDLQPLEDLFGVKVFDIAGSLATGTNNTLTNNGTSFTSRFIRWRRDNVKLLEKRDTCRYVKVVSGDGCASLVSRCGISSADFYKYNPKSNLCATLQPGDYVCCSAGDPYTEPKPDPPKANPDGTCATHLIQNGDTCAALAENYGITIEDIEKYNKGKTWAWTECKDMLLGYNMCISDGSAPLPPAQQGAECGPLVPGTQPPTDKSISMADLNPCPLKACCSNWGFCGVFPAHCDIHAPPGGGPGSKLKDYQNTCVSNCGTEIKQNSGPPAAFQRIGYYESYNLERECLWLKAKNANTDGSYTHIHWSFAEIDPSTWKPIINDANQQWSDFKALTGVKRIVSFGGWAYSTEPATYNIIRSAIINNRDTFTSNLAQFVEDEAIDGIDIDWEYPGAPDIYVGGQPIGQKSDGADYLKFLTTLKEKLGTEKSVSIAAPASYWYLKAFPIDRIAAVIDYIVYMTYDLHGQWDYGNVNAFDSCPSGKCIRSHVNLTETRNSLTIITKAGVPNNKIFVGEASYGRSFHMAQDGCWGPMCDFTGSRTQSDAQPGRCTKTGGYLAAAEINEIIQRSDGVQIFHDGDSNTDVMLYKGDYVSYTTPTTKETRRADWKSLNFAGSIDWAVDLQSFTADDMDTPPDRPKSGEGCVSGEDDSVNSGDLCEFSCAFGFCPESLCTCITTGPLQDLPAEKAPVNVTAVDESDVDLNRLCKFACKYGYCPEDICITVIPPENELVNYDDPNYYDSADARYQNSQGCIIFNPPDREVTVNMCKDVCQDQLDGAAEEGRTSNYGCVGFFPLDQPIPWDKAPGQPRAAVRGSCSCDNWLMNEIADFVIEALPIIAEIGCYIIMSSLKLVLTGGLDFIPGPGKVLDVGLDMATTAAQMVSYIYPEDQDPEGAFSWWLSPCGGTDLVPDDIKNVFDILSQVADGVSSFKPPKGIGKGSGRKGDDGNPIDRGRPRPLNSGSGSSDTKKPCRIPPSKETQRLGAAKNTYRVQKCVADQTMKYETVITSISYAADAVATPVTKHCDKAWSQACYHYSSAISVNEHWATLTCPPEAASTSYRLDGVATATWLSQHRGAGWTDRNRRGGQACDKDEYPPAYLLSPTDSAYINGGLDSSGQLVRFVPNTENQRAGQVWKGVCFNGPVKDMSDRELRDKVDLLPDSDKNVIKQKGLERTMAAVTVTSRPEFSFSSWGQADDPPMDDGLLDNPCWPREIAAGDPGFVLLTYDPYYEGNDPPYDYAAAYVQGVNGS